MRRRDFILGVGVATLPVAAVAQNTKPFVIGVLIAGSQASSGRYVRQFERSLTSLGYTSGRNIELVYRYADGDASRLPLLAAEIAAQAPSIIACGSTSGAVAAKKAAPETPVVSAVLTDPIGFGLAASHQRPGGTVTGILNTVETLPGKQVEFALETVGGADAIGIVANANNPSNLFNKRAAEEAARARGVSVHTLKVRRPVEIRNAFEELAGNGAKVAVLLQDVMFLAERKNIAAVALDTRLPTMYSFREHAEDGGLLSYGVDLVESWQKTARLVDRILNRARPGDLPIEFPAKFELVINLRTAKALGLTIPPTLLARADEVIE